MKSRIRLVTLIYIWPVIFTPLCAVWYYVPRSVKFELDRELSLPRPDLDYYSFIGFDKAEDEDDLWFWLFENPARENPGWQYDSLFVKQLVEELDFDEFDYLICFQKQLLNLRYSPYLRKTKDDIYWDKRIPLVASWDTVRTDRIYLYRIKSNSRFRSAGP